MNKKNQKNSKVRVDNTNFTLQVTEIQFFENQKHFLYSKKFKRSDKCFYLSNVSMTMQSKDIFVI